jgi:agmatine deiminase
MEETMEILTKSTDQYGKPFNIVRIPCPPALYYEVTPNDGRYEFYTSLRYNDGTVFDGNQNIRVILAASYCNFILSNGVVLIPKYYKPGRSETYKKTDEAARSILQQLYPNRQVVALDVESVNLGMTLMRIWYSFNFLRRWWYALYLTTATKK